MSIRETAPTATPVESGPWKGSTEFNHPAFGQVTLTRWQSGGRGHRLFGSDLSHSSGITIKVSRAELRRALSTDGIHATEPVVEFSMSESQWSRMVSAIGLGSGVPVTLRHYRSGEFVEAPLIAAPELSRKELHAHEMRERLLEALQTANEQIDRMRTMIDEGKLSKKDLRELHATLSHAVGRIPGNVAFAFDTFTEALEQVVGDAKSEFEAHIGAFSMRLGMEHLRDTAPRLEGAEPRNLIPGDSAS